jgi:hypothetical protein
MLDNILFNEEYEIILLQCNKTCITFFRKIKRTVLAVIEELQGFPGEGE